MWLECVERVPKKLLTPGALRLKHALTTSTREASPTMRAMRRVQNPLGMYGTTKRWWRGGRQFWEGEGMEREGRGGGGEGRGWEGRGGEGRGGEGRRGGMIDGRQH